MAARAAIHHVFDFQIDSAAEGVILRRLSTSVLCFSR
jgi:hypothetical protein